MVQVLFICQVRDCGREFRDMASYYEHVSSHEEEKKVNK